jgi:hypothetical protein
LESAWATPVKGGFKLDNILFYATGYALSDVVAVKEKQGELYVSDLVLASGHSTVRVVFLGEADLAYWRQFFDTLGCASEISNLPRLVAFDIPASVNYNEIKKVLEMGEADGKWEYEEACLAQ